MAAPTAAWVVESILRLLCASDPSGGWLPQASDTQPGAVPVFDTPAAPNMEQAGHGQRRVRFKNFNPSDLRPIRSSGVLPPAVKGEWVVEIPKYVPKPGKEAATYKIRTIEREVPNQNDERIHRGSTGIDLSTTSGSGAEEPAEEEEHVNRPHRRSRRIPKGGTSSSESDTPLVRSTTLHRASESNKTTSRAPVRVIKQRKRRSSSTSSGHERAKRLRSHSNSADSESRSTATTGVQ